jgi:hypothetical protein
MPFYWSENAKIALTYYESWKDDFCIPENIITSAEMEMGIQFPKVLRQFYASWGNYDTLTSAQDIIFHPKECYIKSNYLIFAVENQAVFYWGIKLDDIQKDNPPVFYIERDDALARWLFSHPSTADFLDGITFGHIYANNFAHGAFSELKQYPEFSTQLLDMEFKQLRINSQPWGIYPHPDFVWVIYYKENILFFDSFKFGFSILANSQDDLNRLIERLNVPLKKIW